MVAAAGDESVRIHFLGPLYIFFAIYKGGGTDGKSDDIKGSFCLEFLFEICFLVHIQQVQEFNLMSCLFEHGGNGG
jgi:hypothetical protein